MENSRVQKTKMRQTVPEKIRQSFDNICLKVNVIRVFL